MSFTVLPNVLVLLAGACAGFVNVVAGGGSLISLPALIFLGLPPGIANGTNRVAILAQNLVAVQTYRAQGVGDYRRAVLLALPAMLGSIAGAWLATRIDETIFKRVIGAILLAMMVLFLTRPQHWLEQKTSARKHPMWVSMLAFGLLGVYGGFIQAGIGVMLLGALVLIEGQDLVSANAAKVTIVLLYTLVALAIFAGTANVHWRLGLVLACGNMVGAYLGARAAVNRGAPWIFRILLVVLTLSGLKLLFGS